MTAPAARGVNGIAIVFAVASLFARSAAAAESCVIRWSCAGSQCAAVMGGYSGVSPPVPSEAECRTWIPPTSTRSTPYPEGSVCDCTQSTAASAAGAGASALQNSATETDGEYVDAAFWCETPGQRVRLGRILEECQDLFSLGLFELPDANESPDEISAYLELIPDRFQRPCAALGSSSWLGLEACWFFEEFSDWLLKSCWHGRFASLIWHLADARHKSRRQRRMLCELIQNQEPKELLSSFMAEPQARSCMNLLKRLKGGALNGGNVEGLLALARSPQKVKALSYMGDIRVESLRHLSVLPEWLFRPNAIVGALRSGGAAFEFLKCLRTHPLLLDKTVQTWIAKRMEAVRNMSDIDGLKERWDSRIAAIAPFPHPPVTLPQPFEPIDTFRKLKSEGRRMNNCSVEYLAEVLAGKSYFYHWSGPEAATVRLIHTSTGGWLPEDISGCRNARLSSSAIVVIRAAVRAAQ